LAEYIKSLAAELFKAHQSKGPEIKLKTQIRPVRLGIDQAVPLGLLINELISNALKHAFRGRAKGQLQVTLREVSRQAYQLIVEDDGVGVPGGLDLAHATSLGLQIVGALSQQLHGEGVYTTQRGTRFELVFSSGGVRDDEGTKRTRTE
jgi:two-component sensor histidine kinase